MNKVERKLTSLSLLMQNTRNKLHDMTLRLDSLYDVIVELGGKNQEMPDFGEMQLSAGNYS